MKIKKTLNYFLLYAFILSNSYTVLASTAPEKIKVISENTLPEDYAADPTAGHPSTYSSDVIVYKYRRLNNKLQYRRWNRTKGVWVDPDWIDVQ